MDIQEIRARCNAATPGPWMWDMRTASKQCLLVTEHSGQFYVMGFDRWGMQAACPTFQVYDNYDGPVNKRGSRGMERADKLAKSYPGKEHHKGFDDYINHPDAIFIAHAIQDVSALLEEVDRLQSELEQVKAERDAAVKDLYKACISTPCNTGICAKKNCHGNIIPCEFEWRGTEGR